MPAAVDDAGDKGTSYRRLYHQRNVWWQSGARSMDTGAKAAESAAAVVDQRQVGDERPPSRRSRFRHHNTESADNLDVDQVLSLLDQMNFKPSKSKVVGSASSPAAADVDIVPSVDSVSVVTSLDDSKQMQAVKETHAASSHSGNYIGVSNRGAEAALDDGDEELSSLQSVGSLNLVTTPPRSRTPAISHIPRTVLAWTSPSGETSAMNAVAADLDNRTSAEPLHSSPVETGKYESSSETQCDCAGGQDDVFKQFSETVAEPCLPTSTAASPLSVSLPANSNRHPDDRGGNSELLREVIGSSQTPPVCRVSHHYPSPGGVTTPRLLSADASYYLEQEEGDVIIESSSEEDFDG